MGTRHPRLYDDADVESGLTTKPGNFPPPKASAEYERKPLPSVPPHRSIMNNLSFSSEFNKAFRTPKHSIETTGNMQVGRDWGRDRQLATGQNPSLARIDVNNIPTMPPDEILSPQPRQCVQKILRLAGHVSPATSASLGSPSGHNSLQKIRQLTGLDMGLAGSNEGHIPSLHALEEEVSPISATSSIYSQEGLEATISEPDLDALSYIDSDYSNDSNDSNNSNTSNTSNELTTALTVPNFGAVSTRHISRAPVSPTSMSADVRLSSFRTSGPGNFSQPDPSRPVTYESQYRQGSLADSWSSSTKSSSTRNITEPYRTTSSEISHVKSIPDPAASTRSSSTGGARPPAALKQRSIIWDNRPDDIPRNGRPGVIFPSPPAGVPSLSSSVNSLSDRRIFSRNHVPPSIEASSDTPRPGSRKYGPSQATPYPPPLPSNMKSAFDDDDDRKRFSLLSKVFGGGGSSSRRDSGEPGRSSGPSPRSGRKAPTPSDDASSPSSARGTWGPDTSWPMNGTGAVGSTTAAAGGGTRSTSTSGGFLQKTRTKAGEPFQGLMAQARLVTGMRSKAEKRRDSLRGMIRVIGTEDPRGLWRATDSGLPEPSQK